MFSNFREKVSTQLFGLFFNSFEQTLQICLDNYFSDLLKEKIDVKQLQKGLSQVELNADYINRLLSTNLLKSAFIGSIQLEKMNLTINDINLQFFLTDKVDRLQMQKNFTKSRQDKVKREMCMQELRKSIYANNERLDQSINRSVEMKNSKTKVDPHFYLKLIETIFGNITVKIFNTKINLTWIDGKEQQRNILIVFNSIMTTLQKLPESAHMFLKFKCDSIKLETKDAQIGEMQNALSCDVYFMKGQQPKLRVEAGLLNVMLSKFEFSCCVDALNIIHQNNMNRTRILSEIMQEIQSEEQKQNLEKMVNFSVNMISDYTQSNLATSISIFDDFLPQETCHLIQSFQELNIPPCAEAVQLENQREKLTVFWQGCKIELGTGPTSFKQFSHRSYNLDLEDHYSFKISKLTAFIGNDQIIINVNKIRAYQCLLFTNQFISCHESLPQNQVNRKSQFENIYVISHILLLGGKSKSRVFKQGNQASQLLLFDNPKTLPKMLEKKQALSAQLEQQNLDIKLSDIIILLNQDQIKFLLQLLPQTQPQMQKVQVQRPYKPQLIQPPKMLNLNKVNCFVGFAKNHHVFRRKLQQYFEQDQQYNPEQLSCLTETNYISLQIKNIQTNSNKDQLITEFKCDELFLANKLLSVPKICGYIRFQKSITEISEVEIETRRGEHLSDYCEKIKGSMPVEVKIDIDKVSGSGRIGDYLELFEYFIAIMNLFPKQIQQAQKSCLNEYFTSVALKFFELKTDLITIELCSGQFFQLIDRNFFTLHKITVIDNVFQTPQGAYQKGNFLIQCCEQQKLCSVVEIRQDGLIQVSLRGLMLNPCDFEMNLLNRLLELGEKFSNTTQQQKGKIATVGGEKHSQDVDSIIPKNISLTLKHIYIHLVPYGNQKIKLKQQNLRVTNPDLTMKYTGNYFQIYIDQINLSNQKINLGEITLSFLLNQQSVETESNKILDIKAIEIKNCPKLKPAWPRVLISAIYLRILPMQTIEMIMSNIQHMLLLSSSTQGTTGSTQKKKTEIINFDDVSCFALLEVIAIDFNFKDFRVEILNSQISLAVNSFQLLFERIRIHDNIPQSKYRYVLDADTANDYTEPSSPEGDDFIQISQPFLGVVVNTDQNTVQAHIKLQRFRILISGYFLESLFKILNETSELAKFQILQEDINNSNKIQQQDILDDDEFIILEQQPKLNLQVIIEPIEGFLSFDSRGISVDQWVKSLIRLGSIDGFQIQAKRLDFHAYHQDAIQLFVDEFLRAFGSPLSLTTKAASSMQLLQPISILSRGIVNMLKSPFQSEKGVVKHLQNQAVGTIVGLRDFFYGCAGSVLTLAQVPSKAIDVVGEAMGFTSLRTPLNLAKGMSQDCYAKINPSMQIPARFYKSVLQMK